MLKKYLKKIKNTYLKIARTITTPSSIVFPIQKCLKQSKAITTNKI